MAERAVDGEAGGGEGAGQRARIEVREVVVDVTVHPGSRASQQAPLGTAR